MLSKRQRIYYSRLDTYRMDLDLPGYEESEDEERDLEELDQLWDEMLPEERSASDYSMHCSEYMNPVEMDIITCKICGHEHFYVPAGGLGGAAHPDKDPSPQES